MNGDSLHQDYRHIIRRKIASTKATQKSRLEGALGNLWFPIIGKDEPKGDTDRDGELREKPCFNSRRDWINSQIHWEQNRAGEFVEKSSKQGAE